MKKVFYEAIVELYEYENDPLFASASTKGFYEDDGLDDWDFLK